MNQPKQTHQSRAISKRALKQGVTKRGGINAERGRFRLMWAVTASIFCLLVGRALWVQVLNQRFYEGKAEQTIVKVRAVHANRGAIYDRFGSPLALSSPLMTLNFNAREYAKEKQQWLERKKKLQQKLLETKDNTLKNYIDTQDARFNINNLAAQIGISVEKILSALSAPKNELPSSQYLILQKLMPPDVAEAILAQRYVGVRSETKYRRFYPQPQPNAHLLGYMGKSMQDDAYKGRAGLELSFNPRLAGKNGIMQTVRGAGGFGTIDNSLKELGTPGTDITLSVDARLQYILYRELEKAGRLHKARSASGIILDPRTGEVLAVSNWPSFNTNNMAEHTSENERNRAFIDIFEPGSVMKPFTVAAALDSGKYNKNSLINTGNGTITIGKKVFRDHGVTNPVSLRTLIVRSSNVASIKIAQSLPTDGITSMYRRLGMGQKTAIGFPAELAGTVTDPKASEKLRRANITFGYSVEVTLAQLAQAYATLANGGVRMPLSITKIDDENPPTGIQVLSKQVADDVLHMMEGVVADRRGTGKRAAISGYRVAGKTGTAKKLKPDYSAYYDDKYRGLFIGIAPASNPRFVTAIVVEDPVGDYYGGIVAAPTFAAVTKEALRLYNVPQDKALTRP